MRANLLLALALVLGLASCSDEEVPTTSTNAPNINRVLNITVSHIYYEQGYQQDSLVPDATVTLYETTDDRLNGTDELAARTTSTTGKVSFGYMNYQTYYLQVVHPDLGTLNRQFTFPDGALTAFEYYDYVD